MIVVPFLVPLGLPFGLPDCPFWNRPPCKFRLDSGDIDLNLQLKDQLRDNSGIQEFKI